MNARAMGVGATIVGAVGSLGLWFRAGGSANLMLAILFIGWILTPFATLLVADRLSPRWSSPTRATLHGLMFVTAVASLAVYGGLVAPPAGARPAFIYLMVPLGLVLLIAISLSIAALLSRTPARR